MSDVVDIISGGTPKTDVPEYWNGEIPWLSVADFNNESRFVYDSEKKITELGLKNSNTSYLEVGDVIISARGTVGALAQIGVKSTFNQSCYGLRAKEMITNDYLYFALGEQIHQFRLNAYGSKFDAITVRTFDDIKFPVPPPDVQEQIIHECEAVEIEYQKELVDYMQANGGTVSQAEQMIKGSVERKRAIFKKYL